MNREEKKKLIKTYLNAFNSIDIKSMMFVLHEKIKFKKISKGELLAITNGIEEFQTLANYSKTEYSLRKQTITSIEFEKYKTIIGIEFEGTLAKNLPNGMRLGEIIRLNGHTEFTFKDNKIFSITDIN